MVKFGINDTNAMNIGLQIGNADSANEPLDVSDDQDGLKTRDPFSASPGAMSLVVLVIIQQRGKDLCLCNPHSSPLPHN